MSRSAGTLSTDPAYVAEQYADAENLCIRAETHRRYTVGGDDFAATELRHLKAAPGQWLLDVGCGPGRLHGVLAAQGVNVVGLDQSLRLLWDARAATPQAHLLQADAVALPFPAEQFDRVCALGMLYHVRDWLAALQEFRRVVRAGGRVVLSTNGADALQRLVELHAQAATDVGYVPLVAQDRAFHLDHLDEVRHVFPTAERHVVHSALEFPAADPALRFYATNRIDLIQDRPTDGSHRSQLLPKMRRLIEEIIVREGVFRVPKSFGYIVAQC